MSCFCIDFLKRTVKWLCKIFYNEKLELIFCEYGEKIEFLNEKKMNKVFGCHQLLIKFNQIMNYEFFLKEKEYEEFLNL